MKLFGGSKGSRIRRGRATATTTAAASAKPKKKKWLKPLAIVLICVVVLEGLYFTAIYSQNSFIERWRSAYIITAMDTMRHQWLAKAFIPEEIINDVMERRNASLVSQEDVESAWSKPKEEPVEEEKPDSIEIDADITVLPDDKHSEENAKAAFYRMFHELDQTSFETYLAKHPEVLDNGWDQIVINEAGKNDKGTDIKTTQGEQVLAIDVPNQILLLRVEGTGYRGILAVAKDPARLSLRPSSTLGTKGETVAKIASDNQGVLAMTGSGFLDPNGGGNGGQLAGYAMLNGQPYGSHTTRKGDKRVELHEDNLMYIYDVSSPVGEDCTDAVEWQPAIIIDGKDVLGYGWDGIHPRAAIGQSDKYEILMLITEGRAYGKGILGTTLYECADILLRYNCMQAMNLDGGASAMLWYNGESIIHCSNSGLEDGRLLPSAFVYGAK